MERAGENKREWYSLVEYRMSIMNGHYKGTLLAVALTHYTENHPCCQIWTFPFLRCISSNDCQAKDRKVNLRQRITLGSGWLSFWDPKSKNFKGERVKTIFLYQLSHRILWPSIVSISVSYFGPSMFNWAIIWISWSLLMFLWFSKHENKSSMTVYGRKQYMRFGDLGYCVFYILFMDTTNIYLYLYKWRVFLSLKNRCIIIYVYV